MKDSMLSQGEDLIRGMNEETTTTVREEADQSLGINGLSPGQEQTEMAKLLVLSARKKVTGNVSVLKGKT